jgi:PAS domain-containing protein
LTATDRLLIHHSWPVYERARHFDLGRVLNAAITDVVEPAEVGGLGFLHAGCWECDLADNSLIWSGGVYDIFGLPRGVQVTRAEAVALYSEESRVAMERLRTYAIDHGCGFTLDTEIRPIVGGRRWMRLIAAPVCDGDRVVRLQGLKLIV